MAGVRRALAADYRQRLQLQETRFCTRSSELKGKADGLKRKLAVAERHEKAVVDAQATVEAEMSFIYKQVEDITSLIGKTSDEADRARALQHMCS